MYFLIEHNRDTKDTKINEYSSFKDASRDRLAKEIKYMKEGKEEIEVVIFEAKSEEVLRKTHSRYFVKDSDKDGFGTFLAIGFVALGVAMIAKYLSSRDD